MSKIPALWAVIPAAGVGSRFSDYGEPKQYALVQNRTVLEHSVDALLQCPRLQQLVIAIHPQDARATGLHALQRPDIRLVQGGAERADSVLAALLSLREQAAADDWVLVHDAARPCLSKRDLVTLVQTLNDDLVGGILAVPAVDTLKQVAGDRILHTVDRAGIWQAQTPQMFRYGLLVQCLQQARADRLPVTDEASAIEVYGYTARVVEGSRSNIKITYPDDLALAAFYLQQEQRS